MSIPSTLKISLVVLLSALFLVLPNAQFAPLEATISEVYVVKSCVDSPCNVTSPILDSNSKSGLLVKTPDEGYYLIRYVENVWYADAFEVSYDDDSSSFQLDGDSWTKVSPNMADGTLEITIGEVKNTMDSLTSIGDSIVYDPNIAQEATRLYYGWVKGMPLSYEETTQKLVKDYEQQQSGGDNEKVSEDDETSVIESSVLVESFSQDNDDSSNEPKSESTNENTLSEVEASWQEGELMVEASEPDSSVEIEAPISNPTEQMIEVTLQLEMPNSEEDTSADVCRDYSATSQDQISLDFAVKTFPQCISVCKTQCDDQCNNACLCAEQAHIKSNCRAKCGEQFTTVDLQNDCQKACQLKAPAFYLQSQSQNQAQNLHSEAELQAQGAFLLQQSQCQIKCVQRCQQPCQTQCISLFPFNT